MKRGALLSVAGVAVLLLACGSSGDDSSTNDGGWGTDGGGKDVSTGTDGSPQKDGSPQSDGAPPTCGTCPTGYSCGSANGIPVCRSTTTNIPLFSHVFVIVMENTSLSTLQAGIKGNQAPNLKSWASQWATGSDYHGVAHPSLPNYLGLTSGGTQGVGCDCSAEPGHGSCTVIVDYCFSCTCDVSAQNLADQLETANKTWMDFGEDMGKPCNVTDSGNYVARHNPFVYYDDIRTNTTRCNAHAVDFSNFDPNSAPDFSFIAPNLVDDMHNPDPPDSTNIPNGDKWLGQHAGAILASNSFKQGGLLVVVWDEDDGSGGLGGNTDDPIGIWVMSPYGKQNGYVSTTHADHYSLLATIEDGLDLGRIGKASQATPLTDYFPAN